MYLMQQRERIYIVSWFKIISMMQCTYGSYHLACEEMTGVFQDLGKSSEDEAMQL